MKKTLYILAIMGLLFGACDKIEEPFLEETGSSGPGPDIKLKKVVLEEFTGHLCVNCPEATQLARNLKVVYGDQLVLISVHAGDLAVPGDAPFDADYRTPAGTEIFNFYDPVGVPTGVVNRSDYEGSLTLFKDQWEPAIQALLEEDPVIYLEIETEYNETSRELDIHVHADFLADHGEAVNLSVLITESGIISAQKNDLASVGEVPDILDYEHQHLLRKAVNGTWGDLLVETVVGGTTMTKDYSLTLDNDWTAENVSVVALAIDSDTYAVIQAGETHIGE